MQDAESEVPAQPQNQGPLWKGLVRRWAQCNMSAGELQQLAAEAVTQGAPGMSGMASIGSFGTNPQHCYNGAQLIAGVAAWGARIPMGNNHNYPRRCDAPLLDAP